MSVSLSRFGEIQFACCALLVALTIMFKKMEILWVFSTSEVFPKDCFYRGSQSLQERWQQDDRRHERENKKD